MSLNDLISGLRFADLSQTDKISLFMWFLHSFRGLDRISIAQINACFDELHLPRPSNTSKFVTDLEGQRRCERSVQGSKLLRDERDRWQGAFGRSPSTVQVDAALNSLQGHFADPDQQMFFDEVLASIRAGAYRSACVMAWNLAFDCICRHIVNSRLVDFNAAAAGAFKTPPPPITKRSDFEEWKEFDVIRVAAKTQILTKNQKAICDERLSRRNMLAHPSSVRVSKLQAEEMILDLVTNVIDRVK